MTTVELAHSYGRLSTNDETLTLPGVPGKAMEAVWSGMTAQERRAFLPHLIGSTSSEWLASTLRDQGFAISSTTIKVYRRSLRQNGTA